MSDSVYNPRQAATLFKYWPAQVDWFLLGGPADADEAQTVHTKYPNVKCVGFEPHPSYVQYQRANGFPGVVYPVALWDRDGDEVAFYSPHQRPRSSGTVRGDEGGLTFPVPTRTLDSLNGEIGPFTNAVLWLDIEYSEVQALRGAADLLASGQVLLINLEVWDSTCPEIEEILLPVGYKEVLAWANTVRDKRDVIYRLGGQRG